MRKYLTVILALVLLPLMSFGKASPRVVEDFNFGWKFILGDQPSFASASLDDSSWRSLHLPHDWSIEGRFEKSNPSTPSGGALPGGIGWYRKHFSATPSDGGKVFVEFDGVFMDSRVYVNGREVGYRPYGYSSFSYEITGLLKDGDNVIAVRCDNSEQPNSRWYAGCGIYRDVRLVKTRKEYVVYNGVQVRTSEDRVYSRIEVGGNPSRVVVSIKSGCKRLYAEASRDAGGVWCAEIRVPDPKLWDIGNPVLYAASVEIYGKDGKLSDTYTQPFGFRSMRWDAEKGFFLNGRSVKLKGVCLHHDLGCIGSAFYPRAMEKRLLKLKEMGCNAIRTSHNPPAPQLLDMCDRMGILVVDEALDMWRIPKTKYDYARFFDEWHEKDISDMVRRDRNHPCIILWSAGNEIPEQFKVEQEEEIARLCRSIVSIFKSLDPDREVCVGLDKTSRVNTLAQSGAFGVLGANYHNNLYDSLKVWYPKPAWFGSEIASALNSRGWYPQPSAGKHKLNKIENGHHQCPSYDNTCAPWSDIHSSSWYDVNTRDHIAGGFVWTGYDYLGEPTPYSWPSRSSYFGIMDLAGFPKDAFYMYQSEWTDRDVLHVFPHWNWKPGDKVDVWCYYGNADEVELFLNGRSLGRSAKDGSRLSAQWPGVAFEPGEIKAVSYRNGRKVAGTSRRTTGEAVALKLTSDRKSISADGYDLCYVTVTAVDRNGLEVPVADDMLRFHVSGAGELFGIDNGNAADTLSLKGNEKALFAGKAIAVIRSIKDCHGKAVLEVESGFDTKTIEVKCR